MTTEPAAQGTAAATSVPASAPSPAAAPAVQAGASLAFALISVESLDSSLKFYRDVLGLTPTAEVRASYGFASEDGELRPGRAVLLEIPGVPVGAIALLEFEKRGERIRPPDARLTRGLWSLGFYVDDLDARLRELAAHDIAAWSEPRTLHASEADGDGDGEGRIRKVILEGPDGVAIELMQPMGAAETSTGRLRHELDEVGRTRAGYTPVATTSQCVDDLAAAVRFYRDVLGMREVGDETLGDAHVNEVLGIGEDARTRSVLMAGGHLHGQVVLYEPCNYDVPRRVAPAHAPNVGYLAQAFVVPDLEQVAASLERLECTFAWRPASPAPGFRGEQLIEVRIPGSGAFALLIAG